MASYNATVTYVDGTTAQTSVFLFQDYNGLTYWAPEASDNAAQDILEAKAIQSLTTHGVATNNFSLGANRQTWDYVTCFTPGTLIETAGGAKPIETLQSGDVVLTRDNGLQPIRWIGSRKIDSATLEAAPNLRPIRIKAGSLGANTPGSDLIVSPQHRVLVRSKIAQRMFGTNEVLVAAKQLLEIEGIEIAGDIHEVEYFHFMFDCHEIVFSNGAETESLYTGPVALRSVSPESRKEILSLFPELAEDGSKPQPARLLTSGRQGRRLAHRHAKNQQEMVY
ncbi:hemolysin [Paracoccus onubensis]|uniref:Hemolysin n=2 Tax=Paracoccus onubensis TaxID=1675788 RepID=A0A418SPI7_9RHOB|nr:hemolysin [Paracoccus onubensis]